MRLRGDPRTGPNWRRQGRRRRAQVEGCARIDGDSSCPGLCHPRAICRPCTGGRFAIADPEHICPQLAVVNKDLPIGSATRCQAYGSAVPRCCNLGKNQGTRSLLTFLCPEGTLRLAARACGPYLDKGTLNLGPRICNRRKLATYHWPLRCVEYAHCCQGRSSDGLTGPSRPRRLARATQRVPRATQTMRHGVWSSLKRCAGPNAKPNLQDDSSVRRPPNAQAVRPAASVIARAVSTASHGGALSCAAAGPPCAGGA